MNPALIIAAVGELATAVTSFQQGNMTADQLAAAWTAAVSRVQEADAAWQAAEKNKPAA